MFAWHEAHPRHQTEVSLWSGLVISVDPLVNMHLRLQIPIGLATL